MEQQSNLPQHSAPPDEPVMSQQELSPSQVIVSQSQTIPIQHTQNVVVDNNMIQNMMIDTNEHSNVVLVTVPEGIGSSADGEVEIIVTTHLTADGQEQLYELPNSGSQYQQLESASGSNITLQQSVYKYSEPVLTTSAGSDPTLVNSTANAIYDSALSSGIIPATQPNTVICSSSASASDIVSVLNQHQGEAITAGELVTFATAHQASEVVDQPAIINQQTPQSVVDQSNSQQPLQSMNSNQPSQSINCSATNQTIICQPHPVTTAPQMISLSRYPAEFNESQSVHEVVQMTVESSQGTVPSQSVHSGPQARSNALAGPQARSNAFAVSQARSNALAVSQARSNALAGPQARSAIITGSQGKSAILTGLQARSPVHLPQDTPGDEAYPQRASTGTNARIESMSPEERELYEKQETMKSLELVEAQWKSSVQSSEQSSGLRSPPGRVVFPTQDNHVTAQEGGMFSYEVVDIKVEPEAGKSQNNENISLKITPNNQKSSPNEAKASLNYEKQSKNTENHENISSDSVQFMDGVQIAGEKSVYNSEPSNTYSADVKNEWPVLKPPGFKCTLCQKKFYEIDELNIHVDSHQRNQSFKCTKCDLMFVNASSLKKHENIHSELSGFKCDECGKTFGSKLYLKSHMKTHTSGKAYNCEDCTLSFMTAKALNKHKVAHSTEDKFCDICKETFASAYFLEQHVLKQHTKQSVQVSKGRKGKKMTKATSSQMKMKTSASRPVTRGVTKKEASKKKVPSFSCMLCKEKFASKALLKEHARTHLGQRVLRCDKCGKVFQDSIKMKMHKLTHSGQSYYCDFCGKIFNYASTLALHKKAHEKEKGFKCRTCKSRFATAEMLKSHRSIHASTKSFVCDICEKAFTSQYYLKTHKRLHTGEKHYGCLQCGESFMFSNGLRRHVNKVHSAEEPSTSAPREVEADDDADYGLDTSVSVDPIFDAEKMKVLQDMASPKRDEDGMFECRYCEKKFQSVPAVNNHMKEHVDLPYTCYICKKTFSCNLYLVKHLRRHDDKQKFECSVCKKSFRSSGYLAQHQKIHTGEKNYACQLCGEEFTFANSLRRHLHNHKDLGPNIQGLVSKKKKLYRPVSEIDENSVNIPTCSLCGYSFQTLTELSDHMESHSGENPVYECSICKKEFNSHRALLKHKQTHVDNKPISCEICNKTFRASYYLKSHMNIHNGHKPYKCKHCDESFTYASTRRRHMRVHIPEESMKHMCSTCGKKFFEEGECERHMLTHSTEKSFMCDICGKTFGNKTLLRNHMKRHNGERQYHCTMCTRTFLYRYRLQRHIKTHTGEKAFKCSICEKSFLTQAYLSTHLRSHTGEKPYKCEVCGEEFSFSNTFRRHKRIHDGLTLNCGVCGKMCLELFDLKRHMQSHSDQKTVTCDYCGKGFSHQGSCKRHIRRTHPEMVMPFPVDNVNMTVEVS